VYNVGVLKFKKEQKYKCATQQCRNHYCPVKFKSILRNALWR